jgi:hypothetical protein
MDRRIFLQITGAALTQPALQWLIAQPPGDVENRSDGESRTSTSTASKRLPAIFDAWMISLEAAPFSTSSRARSVSSSIYFATIDTPVASAVDSTEAWCPWLRVLTPCGFLVQVTRWRSQARTSGYGACLGPGCRFYFLQVTVVPAAARNTLAGTGILGSVLISG